MSSREPDAPRARQRADRHEDLPDVPPEVRPDVVPDELRTALLEAIEPVMTDPARTLAVKQRLMRRVVQAAAVCVTADSPNSPDAPAPALAGGDGLITVRTDQGDWKPFLPRVSIKVLHRDRTTQSYLLRLAPGAAVLPHDHPQDEECVVLQGSARLGTLELHAGDYHRATAGHPHQAISSDDGALLFLRGAIPSADQVRWLSLGTLAALAPARVRRFVERW